MLLWEARDVFIKGQWAGVKGREGDEVEMEDGGGGRLWLGSGGGAAVVV
jgi:hypothetical protein